MLAGNLAKRAVMSREWHPVGRMKGKWLSEQLRTGQGFKVNVSRGVV